MSWFNFEIDNFKNGATSFSKTGDCFKYEAQIRNIPYRYVDAGVLSGSNDRFAYFPMKKGKKQQDLLNSIKETIGSRVTPYAIKLREEDFSTVYSKDFYLGISQNDGKVNFSCYSFDDDLFWDVVSIFKEHLNLKQSKNSNVYMLATNKEGLQTSYMGSFKKTLNKNNYSEDVLKSFNSCVKEIKKKNPRGRLSVFYGPPGTGKTYLLRSLINSIPDGIFFSLQPEIFKKHNATELIQALAPYKGSKIILMIEDADSILCDRKNNSEDIVSNVLNLTDGFMSECLDVNLVCTTNIQKLQIDRAYRRRGRMNSFIEIGPLSTGEAQKAYDSIKNKNKPEFEFKEEAILADIYAKADPDFEYEEEEKPQRRIGFAPGYSSDSAPIAAKSNMSIK